jgi:nucleotide-binding universal stress UspA family protein
MKFKKILFPVDFSDRCHFAAPHVHAVAKRDGASVTLAAYLEIPAIWYGALDAPCMPDINFPNLIDEAQHNLTFFADEYFRDVPCDTLADAGDPGRAIPELAEKGGFDLIMLPTHGRGPVRAALLGSVTAKVLHDTSVPVWTSAHLDRADTTPTEEWKTVMCAVDATDESLKVIEYAKEMAGNSTKVFLVHAINAAPETYPETFANQDFERFLSDSARRTINRMQREAGTKFPLCIHAGTVSSVIEYATKQHNGDLVLTGRGALPHFGGRFRTHVYSIIRDSHCPVLSV